MFLLLDQDISVRDMQKEEELLQKRLIELSKVAYQRNIITYSDFLNLNELHILHTTPKQDYYVPYNTFGGYDSSERQMVAFLPDALYCEPEYPMSVIQISPVQKKFADKLTHRDFLGTVLGLGIERSKIGDILVQEQDAFLFAHSSICDFIIRELSRIKHTTVLVNLVELDSFDYQPGYEEITGTVASVRLDSLLSIVYKESRSKLVGLIEGAKVYVNGKLITTNSYSPKEADIISVRGYGKFKYMGMISTTKKGRYYISIHKYI